MKFRKHNRENRNRWKYMLKVKHRRHQKVMPKRDRERMERIHARGEYGHRRYGSEGLTCTICGQGVATKMNRQTEDGRNAAKDINDA